MIDSREQYMRNQEKAAAAAAAAAQAQQKTYTTNLTNNRLHVGGHSLPMSTIPRPGTLYESRSSISSPYGSGSSLNRTSSIRRASIRDREKVKKLNENFLDVLQARDKIPEDVDETVTNTTISNGSIPSKTIIKEERANTPTTTTDSTIREPVSIKKPTNTSTVELPSLKIPPPLPLPPCQTTADTLSDVKRRREERRRGVTGQSSSITSLPLPIIDMNHKNNIKMSNGNHISTITDPMQNYSSEKYIEFHSHIPDDDHEKRICCTIL
jgi:hypothetical protein